MSGRLDYARAKRQAAGRRGELITPAGPYRSSLQGWRTEWDGEPFPVTTTLIKAGDTMEDMRAIDGNGHVPDEPSGIPPEILAKLSGGVDPADIVRLAYELGHARGLAEGLLERIQAAAA